MQSEKPNSYVREPNLERQARFAARRKMLQEQAATAPPQKGWRILSLDPKGMGAPPVPPDEVEPHPQFNPTRAEILQALADQKEGKPLDPRIGGGIAPTEKAWAQVAADHAMTDGPRQKTPKWVEEIEKYNMTAVLIWLVTGIVAYLAALEGHNVIAALLGCVSFVAFMFHPK